PWGALTVLLLVFGAAITWTLGPKLPHAKPGLVDLLAPITTFSQRKPPSTPEPPPPPPTAEPDPESLPELPPPTPTPRPAHASPAPSASPGASPSAAPSPAVVVPPQLVPLGKNDRGYHEFRCTTDDGKMVLIPRGAFWM